MLEHCRVNLIAHDGRQTGELRMIAQRAGFGLDGGHERPAEAPVYFLVHHGLSTETMLAVLKALRSDGNAMVQFAPAVLFIPDGPFEDYLRYIDLGFDDVIALPEKRPLIVQRLSSQLESDQVYLETACYLGPDRRRMEVAAPVGIARAEQPHSHTRIHFRRTFKTGVKFLRREVFLSSGTQGTRRAG